MTGNEQVPTTERPPLSAVASEPMPSVPDDDVYAFAERAQAYFEGVTAGRQSEQSAQTTAAAPVVACVTCGKPAPDDAGTWRHNCSETTDA